MQPGGFSQPVYRGREAVFWFLGKLRGLAGGLLPHFDLHAAMRTTSTASRW